MSAPAQRWHPFGTQRDTSLPAVGTLVALDHEVYRVLEIRPKPKDLWTDEDRGRVTLYEGKREPVNVIVRPAQIKGDDPKLRRHDLHLRAYEGMWWDVYPNEHYPVCAECGEPIPCRELAAIREAEQAAALMARYEVAGMCPACQEPVTQNQGSRTFEENLYMPGGPPVTFHASRRQCHGGLVSYEDRWVAADPEHRPRRYRCEGVATVHADTGTYECTAGVGCPGAQASHRALTACRCPEHDHWFRGLAPDARNLASGSAS